MRYAKGELIGDLNDDVFATSSKDIASIPALTSFNENETFYDLLPVIVNRPPVISGSIVLESDPNIKDIDLTNGTGAELYVNRDGVVRVARNATITFRFKARQPSVANVENGVLQVIPDDRKIKYVWRKDDAVVSGFTIPSVKSKTTVNNNELTIERIQIRHSGVYTCDAVNDIGTTTSEPITIEVVDPYEDPLLFRNLVENPYGKDGTQGWNSNNQNFTTKQFTNISSVELKTPHRVDLFGYNVDMMHPRPYQIDPGPIRGVDFYTDLTTDAGTFFTRTPYKYDSTDGEPMYVSAYQDIELADVADMIKGGVFGVSGLRAVFTCYIGNAVTTYIPTVDNVTITNRLSKAKYFSGAPRLSLENFLIAGPSKIYERCYVTLEEFEDETRLVSTLLGPNGEPIAQSNTITIKDPWDWSTVRAKYWGSTQYYDQDLYGLGTTSKTYSGFDVDLFAADELGPKEDRFTFGQYVKFNKVIIDKLNPKTNKIRIGIHFNNDIPHLLTFKKFTDDPTDIPEWHKLHKKNTFDEETFGYFDRLNRPTNENGLGLGSVPPRQKYTYLQSPRPMVTGVTFGLIPIVQDNPQRTAYETATAFTLNSLPAGFVPNVLTIRPFDPLGKLRREVTTRFSHRSTFGESTLSGVETMVGLSPDDLYQDTTFIQSKLTIPSSPSFVRYLTGSNLFPFAQGVGTLYAGNRDAGLSEKIKKYGIAVGQLHGVTTRVTANDGLFTYTGLREARLYLHLSLNQLSLISNFDDNASPYGAFNFGRQVWTAGYGRGTTRPFDDELEQVFQSTWHGKARFICHYVRSALPPPSIDDFQANLVVANINNAIPDTRPIDGNSYYVELDLTDPESPKSIIWRDSNLVGMHTGTSGSQSIFGPFQMETGYTRDYAKALHFKLPDEIVQGSLVEGGLALSKQVPISISLSSSTYPVANGQALNALLSDPIGFRAVVQVLGEEFGRTLIKNMWPDISMFTAVPGNNNDSQFESTLAFNDYVEFHRRATYDYLTRVPSGSESITVPYRFGPAPPGVGEQFVGFLLGDPDLNVSTNVDDRLFFDGVTTISVGMLLERREGLYGQFGTRLYMRKGLQFGQFGASKLFVCTPGEYSEAISSNKEIIYTSPTFLRLQRLIGTSTDLESNSFTISIDRSFSEQIADQQGFNNSQNQVSITGQAVNRYRRISQFPTVFVNATVEVLSVDFTTPSNVLVRNAASSLYAVEVAPYSPSPIYENFQLLAQTQSLDTIPTLFTTQSVGTPVFALGPEGTYYYIKYSTILDQQVWFNTPVPNGLTNANLLW